ncbi:hypothetical protein [Streptomyces sp. ODS28]|uniref:hypothetical protein n=1 Tax=Streptomyces sp. ODS28 TaxID=3136688 RepID=UPI0031EEA20D
MSIVKRRAAAASGLAVAAIMAAGPAATAAEPHTGPDVPTAVSQKAASGLTSHLAGVGSGFESNTRWSDSKYNQIKFTGCTVAGAKGKSTHVQLKRDVPLRPDPTPNQKRFTGCFNSKGSHSYLTSHKLDKGTYYFRIAKINDTEHTRYTKLSVKTVNIKTKK